LLAAGIASADTNDVVQGRTLEVMERMHVLELINVTAEKPPADDAEPLSDELIAILQEAEALEEDDSEAR
jgi:hypothetical protein